MNEIRISNEEYRALCRIAWAVHFGTVNESGAKEVADKWANDEFPKAPSLQIANEPCGVKVNA